MLTLKISNIMSGDQAEVEKKNPFFWPLNLWREETSTQSITLGGSAWAGRSFAGSETDLNKSLGK